MDWNTTEDRTVFMAVYRRAKAAFPQLSETDWRSVRGQRTVLVTIVAQRLGIDATAAEQRVKLLEDGLNYSRAAL